MLNISVEILAFGSFLDLLIPLHGQWLMGVEEFSHQVGMSMSSAFWENIYWVNYILPINNIIYACMILCGQNALYSLVE